MINRNISRVVFDDVEITKSTQNLVASPAGFVLTTAKALYIGARDKFAQRYIEMGTANTNAATLTVKYWDGAAWTAVDDLVDETVGCTTNGFISWKNKTNWQVTTVTGIDTDIELYWIQVTTSADFSAGTTLQLVSNIFCDLALLRMYYPEIATDTRFLPSGRTTFIEQFKAAKDLVVLRLRQRRVIEEEGQIIDVPAVSIAAVHATAYIILNPIATSEGFEKLRDTALKAFENEIDKINFDVDEDEDGVQDDSERREFMSARVIRR